MSQISQFTLNNIYCVSFRTGEFTITVFASNDISNGTASSHVFVMKDQLCYPPVIRIVGGSQRKVRPMGMWCKCGVIWKGNSVDGQGWKRAQFPS